MSNVWIEMPLDALSFALQLAEREREQANRAKSASIIRRSPTAAPVAVTKGERATAGPKMQSSVGAGASFRGVR